MTPNVVASTPPNIASPAQNPPAAPNETPSVARSTARYAESIDGDVAVWSDTGAAPTLLKKVRGRVRLRVLDERYGHYQVELPDGTVGYVWAEDVRVSFSVWPAHDSLAVWDDPNNGAPKRLLSKVNRGVELRVLSREDAYFTVALPDHTTGWVRVDSVSEAPPVTMVEPTIDRGTGDMPFVAPVPATFGKRVGGYVIDLVLNSGVVFALAFVLYLLLLPDRYTQQDLDSAQGSVTLISFAVLFTYKWVTDSLGGTLGKRIVGLRVVEEATHEAPGLWVGFTRTLVSIGSGLLLGLGYISAAWDDETKTWHDHAAGTIVINHRRAQRQQRSQR